MENLYHAGGVRNTGTGLRERKKAQTRRELSLATIGLAIDNGWDSVSTADIVAAAGVSERTFRNYFAGKADAVAALHLDRMRQIGAELRLRSSGEPLWAALPEAVLTGFESDSEAAASGRGSVHPEGLRRVHAEPAVRGAILAADAQAQHELAVVIAERIGSDTRRDAYPKLIAAVVGAACAVAVEHALAGDGSVSVDAVLRDNLGLLARGLP